MNHTTNPALSGEELNLDKLEALDIAATRGPWVRSERLNGPFWHISSDFTIDGEPCKSGRQAVGAIHGESKRGAVKYAAMFEANADLIVAMRNALPALIAQARAARQSQPVDVPADLAYLLEYIPVGAVRDEAKRKLAALAGVQAANSPADERFFLDHMVWHDRVTGQHMWTQDQYDETWRDMYKAGHEDAAHGFNMLTGKSIAPDASDDTQRAKLVSQVHYWMDRGDRATNALDAAENEIIKLRAALAQAAPAVAADERALDKYNEHMQDTEELDPVERLRFFCSLAMNGRDWLDVEPFFDAITQARATVVAPTVPAPKPIGYITTGDVEHTSECAEIGDWDIEWDHKVIDAMEEFAVPETTYAVYLEQAAPAAQSQPAGAPTDELPYVEGWSLPRDLATAHTVIQNLRIKYAEEVAKSEGFVERDAAQPAGAGAPSIDTPEFREVLAEFGNNWANSEMSDVECRADVVAYIDAHIARQGAAPAQAEPVAMPTQRMYMDQIDAGNAGEEWLRQHLLGAVRMLRSDEPPGGQSMPVKWVALLDRNDRLTHGYMLTRDIMNWTQITFIDATAPAPAPAGVAQAEPKFEGRKKIDGKFSEWELLPANESPQHWRGKWTEWRFITAPSQPAAPAATTAPEALKFAAKVIELYDDATMQGDYMIDSGDCAAILSALADYFSRAAIQASANNTGSDK